MMSFDIKGDEETHQKFLRSLQLVTHAVSLGDVESLIVYYDRNSDKLPTIRPSTGRASSGSASVWRTRRT